MPKVKARGTPPPPTPEEGLSLVQRSYWIRKEDAAALDTLKNHILLYSDVPNLDLSAVVRGLISHATEIHRQGGRNWERFAEVTIEGMNPKRRGPPPGSIKSTGT